MLNSSMPKVLFGKLVDEDVHTIHYLQGKTYILLAEFSMSNKGKIIDLLQNKYPEIAEKLKCYKGGAK